MHLNAAIGREMLERHRHPHPALAAEPSLLLCSISEPAAPTRAFHARLELQVPWKSKQK